MKRLSPRRRVAAKAAALCSGKYLWEGRLFHLPSRNHNMHALNSSQKAGKARYGSAEVNGGEHRCACITSWGGKREKAGRKAANGVNGALVAALTARQRVSTWRIAGAVQLRAPEAAAAQRADALAASGKARLFGGAAV